MEEPPHSLARRVGDSKMRSLALNLLLGINGGLSRRLFTKEFKLAAGRRLEQGISIAEVVRGLEVNPNVLHRWRRHLLEGPGRSE